MKGAKGVTNKPAVATLVLNGFIDIEPILNGYWTAANGQAFAITVLRQIAEAQNKTSLLEQTTRLREDNKNKESTAARGAFRQLLAQWRRGLPNVTWESGSSATGTIAA